MSENKDVEKLSKDDLDNISGGKATPGPEKGTVYIDGNLVNEAQLSSAYLTLVNQFGYDIAIDQFRRNTGYTCTEMRDNYHWQGDKSDVDKMTIVLYRFWTTMDGAKR